MIKEQNKKSEKGAAALVSILAILMILLSLGLAIAFSGYIQNDIAANQNRAALAFYAAEAGIKDATQKITRNKNYSSAGYNLQVENSNVYVIVNILSFPSQSAPGQTQIISSGKSENNAKKIAAIVDVDNNGKVTFNNWEELSN